MKKKECSALRGIAIIFIMLHNYCHWLPFAVPENEFSYDLEKYILFGIPLVGILYLSSFSHFGDILVYLYLYYLVDMD